MENKFLKQLSAGVSLKTVQVILPKETILGQLLSKAFVGIDKRKAS